MRAVIYFYLLCLAISQSVIANNGSSGVGNAKVMISKEHSISLDGSKYHFSDGIVTTYNTNKEILKFEKLSEEVAKVKIKQSVSAKIGAVQGWESLPSQGQQTKNSWIFCEQATVCYQIYISRAAGFESATILGTLTKEKSKQ